MWFLERTANYMILRYLYAIFDDLPTRIVGFKKQRKYEY